MKSERIGNDIKIEWGILRQGVPFSLTGKDVTIYLGSPFGRTKISGFSIDSNKVLWTFFGKDQKSLGKYSLILVVNEGNEGMITTDICDFVNLVRCSCEVGGVDDVNVQTETISLTSNLEYVATDAYDDAAVWEYINKLEKNKADRTEIPTKVSQLENDADYATKGDIDGKQDEIEDLDAIRSGAAKGATALQSIPAEFINESELSNALSPYARKNDIATINGKSIVNGGNIEISGGGGSGYDDTEIRAELDELSAEVSELSGNTTIVCPNNQYFQVSKIAVGEEISITLNEVATQGRAITFFAKTAISDSSYQNLGTLSVGGKLSVKADREINYIRPYNDYYDAFPATIVLQTQNGVIGRVERLENAVGELEQTDMGEQKFTFPNNQYTPFHIEQGKEYKITALDVQGGRRISFFAKTETTDSTYQRLGDLLEGESAIFVADREINYVRAYSDYGDAFPVTMLLQSTAGLSYQLSELQKNVAEAKTIPCMYNPSINWSKETLNVLDIGNSYTGDCHTYLADIIGASGVQTNITLYKAIRSSGSFKTWVDCYNNRDNSTYSVSKTYGESLGIDASGAANNGEVFRNALAKAWDVIIIHQVSNFSTNYDEWESQSASGYLKEFIQILRKTNPQATIGFLMTHSYRSNYTQNTEKDSLLRWEKIAEATKQFAREYGVDFIIPYGTAVQNLRASSLNDAYEFSEDGTHLGAGLGDYVAGCCYYQALIAPKNGMSIEGNTFRITNLDESVGGRKNVTDETAPIAQRAAMLACCDMWKVNNPNL